MHTRTFVSILAFAASSVVAHGAMTAGFGDFNPTVRAKGFGIVDSTPRTGTRRDPFQSDTSIIRDRDAGTAGVCGKTLANGPNDVQAGMATAQAVRLKTCCNSGSESLIMQTGEMAQVAATTGIVSMTIHKVNDDGKGPYTCDYSGDGQTFVPMSVLTDVPSTGRETATDFPLVAKLPRGVEPGSGIVRCRNNARAGPFGGCLPVQVMAA